MPRVFLRMMEKFGIKKSAKEVTDIIQTVDYNGDGEINFVEFVTMIHSWAAPSADTDVDFIFETFAGKTRMVPNGKVSSLSRADLSLACKQLHQPIEDDEVEAIFVGIGLEGRGAMSRKQFKDLFSSTCQQEEVAPKKKGII